MTAVVFVMGFDVAQIAILASELPLDQKIGAVRVIRILLGFEHGLVAVAIAEYRSGDAVGVKMHDSPALHIRLKKAYRDPGRFETASPRYRHGTNAANGTRLLGSTGSVDGASVVIRGRPL